MSVETNAVRAAIHRAVAFRRGDLAYLRCPDLQVHDDLVWRVWDETRREQVLDGGLGDSTSVSSGGRGQRAIHKAAVGGKPSVPSGVEVPRPPTNNFDKGA